MYLSVTHSFEASSSSCVITPVQKPLFDAQPSPRFAPAAHGCRAPPFFSNRVTIRSFELHLNPISRSDGLASCCSFQHLCKYLLLREF